MVSPTGIRANIYEPKSQKTFQNLNLNLKTSRSREMVSREAHNLQNLVRFQTPQHGNFKNRKIFFQGFFW